MAREGSKSSCSQNHCHGLLLSLYKDGICLHQGCSCICVHATCSCATSVEKICSCATMVGFHHDMSKCCCLSPFCAQCEFYLHWGCIRHCVHHSTCMPERYMNIPEQFTCIVWSHIVQRACIQVADIMAKRQGASSASALTKKPRTHVPLVKQEPHEQCIMNRSLMNSA